MFCWRDEMDNMLAVFDRQAKISLNNIKSVFKHNGLSLNAEFKQYFLNASNDRIKTTYDQFEIDFMLEKQVNFLAGVNEFADNGRNSKNTENYDFNEDQKHIVNPIEIIDLCDDMVPARREYNSNGTLGNTAAPTTNRGRPVQYSGGGTSSKNYIETRIGSTTIRKSRNDGHSKCSTMTDINASEFNIPSMVRSQNVRQHDKNWTKKAPVVSSVHSQRTSALISNIQPNVTDDAVNNYTDVAVKNNMMGRSNRHERGKVVTQKSVAGQSSSDHLHVKKRFKCDHCEFSCDYKSRLIRHIYTHTSEKPYRCDICHKGFTQLQNMKRHKLIHIEQTPFHCRRCFIGFSQKAEQDTHEKVCKKRRYECHICKKVTFAMTYLTQHMRKHNGEKPFRCEICMKCFTQKSSLKRHLDTIHA